LLLCSISIVERDDFGICPSDFGSPIPAYRHAVVLHFRDGMAPFPWSGNGLESFFFLIPALRTWRVEWKASSREITAPDYKAMSHTLNAPI
jgi:hypothetical protein